MLHACRVFRAAAKPELVLHHVTEGGTETLSNEIIYQDSTTEQQRQAGTQWERPSRLCLVVQRGRVGSRTFCPFCE